MILPTDVETAAVQRDRYKAILDEIGAILGLRAPQTVSDIPELVKDLLAVKGFKSARLPEPEPKTLPAVPAADYIETWDDFVYESRKVDGYSKGSYAMIDGIGSMKKLASEVRRLPFPPPAMPVPKEQEGFLAVKYENPPTDPAGIAMLKGMYTQPQEKE